MNKPQHQPQPFWERIFYERLHRVNFSTSPAMAKNQLCALLGYIDALLYSNVIGVKKHQGFLDLIKESEQVNVPQAIAAEGV